MDAAEIGISAGVGGGAAMLLRKKAQGGLNVPAVPSAARTTGKVAGLSILAAAGAFGAYTGMTKLAGNAADNWKDDYESNMSGFVALGLTAGAVGGLGSAALIDASNGKSGLLLAGGLLLGGVAAGALVGGIAGTMAGDNVFDQWKADHPTTAEQELEMAFGNYFHDAGWEQKFNGLADAYEFRRDPATEKSLFEIAVRSDWSSVDASWTERLYKKVLSSSYDAVEIGQIAEAAHKYVNDREDVHSGDEAYTLFDAALSNGGKATDIIAQFDSGVSFNEMLTRLRPQ